MTATLLGMMWGLVALGLVARARPAPRRVRALISGARVRTRRPISPLEVLGRLVLRAAGRPPPGPQRARSVGALTIVTTVVAALAPTLAPVVVLAGWAVPQVKRRRAERARLDGFEADLPQVVDLLALAVGAGLNVSLAVGAAGRWGGGPLAVELRRVAGETSRGRRLADCLDELPARAGEAVRPLASALGRL